MANRRIRDLPAGNVNASDLVPITNGSVTFRATVEQLNRYQGATGKKLGSFDIAQGQTFSSITINTGSLASYNAVYILFSVVHFSTNARLIIGPRISHPQGWLLDTNDASGGSSPTSRLYGQCWINLDDSLGLLASRPENRGTPSWTLQTSDLTKAYSSVRFTPSAGSFTNQGRFDVYGF